MFHKIVIYGRPGPEIPFLVYFKYLFLHSEFHTGGVTLDTITTQGLTFN